MGSKRKFSILIIDDDPKIRELLQAFFSVRSEEVSCVVAADIMQASQKLSNQDFDLIIVDNILPIKMGVDFALHLKRSVKYSKLDIILMSGALQQEDVVKAVEGGIREVLVKPFTLKQLGDRISPYVVRFYKN